MTAPSTAQDATQDSLRQCQSHRRRRSSVTSTITNLAHQAEAKIEQTLSLLFWDDLPSWRRDNAYIRSGYRSDRGSYANSARSLLRLHNETVNIWSHLLGAIVAVVGGVYLYWVIRPRYDSATQADVTAFACFFAGAVVCLGMSATYHAILDHSEDVAKWGNKLDYVGIVALIVGSYMPALFYGFYCQPRLMAIYMFTVCIMPTSLCPTSLVSVFRRLTRCRSAFLALAVPWSHGSRGSARQSYAHTEQPCSLPWVVLVSFLCFTA